MTQTPQPSLKSQLRVLKAFLFLGLISCTLAAIIAAGMLYRELTDWRFARQSQDGIAYVIKSDQIRTHAGPSYRYDGQYTNTQTTHIITYRLTIDGMNYTADRFFKSKSYQEQPVGAAVSVRYLPNDPSSFRLQTTLEKKSLWRLFWPGFFVILFGGVGSLITAFARSQSRKLLSKRCQDIPDNS